MRSCICASCTLFLLPFNETYFIMKFINDIIRRHVATLRIIPMLAVAAVMLAACGDDDNGTSGSGSSSRQSNNANANPNTRKELRLLEFPRVKGDDNNLIIVHSTAQYGINYSIEWDCEKRAQRWTCYEMHKGNNVSNWRRYNWYSTSWNGDPFQEDPDIPAIYNVTLYDHVGDGFDRGHICASQDRMCSREVNEQTFYLSNMQPQYNAFNAGIWADMEGQVRRWNRDSFRDTLYICKGGTIDKEEQILMYSNKGLVVPKYFFMAVLCKNTEGYKAMAFWIEHTNESRKNDALSKYVISIDRLESMTGIDFFCNLPDDIEYKVERNVYPQSWGIK